MAYLAFVLIVGMVATGVMFAVQIVRVRILESRIEKLEFLFRYLDDEAAKDKARLQELENIKGL